MAMARLLLALVVVTPGVEGASLRTQKAGSQLGLWRPCGNEGEEIAEEGLVRFGFGSSWVEGRVPRGASCGISTFGNDPFPGIQKMCECSGESLVNIGATTLIKDDMGYMWSRCAKEGEDCSCDSGTVRFGFMDRWVVTEQGAARGSHVTCSTEGFGGKDPVQGQNKECFCQIPPASGSLPRAKASSVAIVLLTRRAPDLNNWLKYHLGYMGVKHVFLDVEDSPGFDANWKSLSQAHRDRVTVWKPARDGTAGDSRPQDDYTTLQNRQLVAMTRAKKESKEMGIDWLLHIDDDELLYTPLHRPIGEVLNSVPHGFDQAYIPNIEAIYDSADVKSCFTETSTANMNRYTFVSYANGKAAVRVADDQAMPAGPHQWRTPEGLEVPSIHLDAETFGSPLWLVHFESCPFNHWEDKFWELGNTSPDKVKAIPFKFYRDSISRFQQCRTRKEAGESFLEGADEDCSQSSLKDLWSHWKTRSNPAIKTKDLMPITIPWDKIKAM
jgi:hypothetical protein